MSERSVGGIPLKQPATFPKSVRIRKRREYLAVQGRGRKLSTPNFLVFVLAHPLAEAPARFGITVTKKIGGAVVRNRVKRLVRESLRRHKLWFPSGREVVFVAKRSASGIGAAEFERELERLCTAHFAAR